MDDFARYLYLPRLAGSELLINAIRGGLALLTWQTDTFAFAESFDEVLRPAQPERPQAITPQPRTPPPAGAAGTAPRLKAR